MSKRVWPGMYAMLAADRVSPPQQPQQADPSHPGAPGKVPSRKKTQKKGNAKGLKKPGKMPKKAARKPKKSNQGRPRLKMFYSKTVTKRGYYAEVARERVPVPFVYDREGYLKVRGLVSSALRRDAVRSAKVVSIPLAGLRAIQKTVRSHRVLDHASSARAGVDHGRARLPRDLPVVLQYGSKRWLVDGTHRSTVALMRGETHVRGRLVDLAHLEAAR